MKNISLRILTALVMIGMGNVINVRAVVPSMSELVEQLKKYEQVVKDNEVSVTEARERACELPVNATDVDKEQAVKRVENAEKLLNTAKESVDKTKKELGTIGMVRYHVQTAPRKKAIGIAALAIGGIGLTYAGYRYLSAEDEEVEPGTPKLTSKQIKKQIKEDEMLARKLQVEEDEAYARKLQAQEDHAFAQQAAKPAKVVKVKKHKK